MPSGSWSSQLVSEAATCFQGPTVCFQGTQIFPESTDFYRRTASSTDLSLFWGPRLFPGSIGWLPKSTAYHLGQCLSSGPTLWCQEHNAFRHSTSSFKELQVTPKATAYFQGQRFVSKAHSVLQGLEACFRDHSLRPGSTAGFQSTQLVLAPTACSSALRLFTEATAYSRGSATRSSDPTPFTFFPPYNISVGKFPHCNCWTAKQK